MQVSLVAYLSSIAATAAAFTLAGIAWRGRRRERSVTAQPQRRPPESVSGPPALELFDAVADGIVVADTQGNLLYWNPAALRLHGFSETDDVQRATADFHDTFVVTRPEDGQPVPPSERPLARMLRGETVRGQEVNVRRADTGQAWVFRYSGNWVDFPTSDSGGGDGRTERRIVLTLQDMTELRRSEAAVRQSELHLREMIESLPQLVWTCRGDDGACDYLSPQFIEFTGVPAAEQLGFGWLNQLHADDRDRAIAEWRRAAAIPGGGSFDVEFRIRRADGAYRWFKTRARPLRDAAGRVVKWFGTNTDVHDAREAAGSREAQASIVEYTGDVVIGTALDGTIETWNRAAERAYGHTVAEAVGRDVRLLLPDGNGGAGGRDEIDALLAQVAQGQGVERVEARRVTRDGRAIDVALTVSPVRDATGRVTGASLIARDVTESKRDSTALRASEARFRHLASSMPQIVWTSDPEGRTTYLNDRWSQVTGLNKAIPEMLSRVVHPDDMATLMGSWESARVSGGAYSVEFRMRHVSVAETAGGDPDAGYRWFLARAVPIRDPGGRVIEWFGTSTDIDDLKRAESLARESEARLRASHALLRAVVEGITDPVYAKDVAGRYLLANTALGASVGRPASSVIGMTDAELFGQEKALPIVEADRRVLTSDEPQTFEELVGVDGRARYYLTTKARYFDADGAVAGVLGISRDITSRKRFEQALHDSEQHLRGVLDNLLMYVAVLDPSGNLVGLNRAAREVLVRRGIDPEALKARPLLGASLSAVTQEARLLLQEGMARAAAGEEVRLEAVPVVTAAPALDLDLMISPMRGVDGHVTHLIASGVDVTGRERAARQARDRQAELAHLDRVRTMGQMAAGLAHELNQPLGAIANYAGACRRMLESGKSAPADLATVMADVQSEALRAGAIIRRLRAFVAKQHPKPAPVDVNQLVEDAIRLLAYDLRAAGVEPRLSLAGGLAPVMADPVQVGQVMVNLIRNALDAMAGLEAGRQMLEIETGAAEPSLPQHVRVAVRDRGCGVPPADLARVFDAFFTTKPGGLGIGLALCRTIIEDHGGHVSAEPNTDGGGGMTFAFTLRTSAA